MVNEYVRFKVNFKAEYFKVISDKFTELGIAHYLNDEHGWDSAMNPIYSCSCVASLDKQREFLKWLRKDFEGNADFYYAAT